MTNTYARAYTEVLEILSHFPYDEYSKIPKEKIEFYKTNMDKNYEYKINPKIELSKQYISKETNAILISLFKDYFATDKQKSVLNNLLNQNQIKLEKEKSEKYSIDNIFKVEKNDNKEEVSLIEIEIEKEKWYEKILKFIRKILKK